MQIQYLFVLVSWIAGTSARGVHARARTDLQYIPPTCNPQDQVNFTCARCNDPQISDRTRYAVDMWQAADGDHAWADMKKYWLNAREHPGMLGAVRTFVQTMTYGWGTDEVDSWQTCGRLDDHCNGGLRCNQTIVPAGAMALNAFANIRMVRRSAAMIELIPSSIITCTEPSRMPRDR